METVFFRHFNPKHKLLTEVRSERIRMDKILSDLEEEKFRLDSAEPEPAEVPPSMSQMSLNSGMSELRNDIQHTIGSI